MIEFALMLWGLTYLLTASSIFAPVRRLLVRVPFGVMVYCPPCSGFWIGGVIAAGTGWPWRTLIYAPLDAAIASAGMMAIVASYVPSNAYDIEVGAGQRHD